MTFFIHVYSGLNNKIIPLISLLRIALKEKKEIRCCWGADIYKSNYGINFYDFFEPFHLIRISYYL